MKLDWQLLLTLALVGIAVGYLGQIAWYSLRAEQRSNCGAGCGTCAKPTAVNELPLVQLEPPRGKV